jgi:hypothetical protein
MRAADDLFGIPAAPPPPAQVGPYSAVSPQHRPSMVRMFGTSRLKDGPA